MDKKKMKNAKLIFVSMFLFVAVGCVPTAHEASPLTEREPRNPRPAAEGTPVKSLKAAANAQPPKEQTPEALIRDLYKVHGEDFKAEKDRILNGKSRKLLDKYFDKNLADLIWKDLTTHTDEVGVIDFDLFYAAQDAEIKNVQVGRANVESDGATVPVTFDNYGTRETVTYKLTKQNGAWKISDIKYRDGGTLLKYFAEGA